MLAPNDTDILQLSETYAKVDGSFRATGAITASGDITASGNIYSKHIYVNEGDNVYFDGNDSVGVPNTYIGKSGIQLDFYVNGSQKLSIAPTQFQFINNPIIFNTIGSPQDVTLYGALNVTGSAGEITS